MHPQLNYIVAQQRASEWQATAERASSPASDPLVLGDGRRLAIRPIERADRQRLSGLFARLTPRSRYRRFLSPKPELSAREVDFLADVDHVRHEALAAVDEADGSFVATARYVQVPGQPGVAEVAIEVADDLHNMGIGSALAARTLERAQANGFTRVVATTLRENAASLALLRRLRFQPRGSCGAAVEFELAVQPRPGREEVLARG